MEINLSPTNQSEVDWFFVSRLEFTLPILVEYYATSKQVKVFSKKTLLGIRSNLAKVIVGAAPA